MGRKLRGAEASDKLVAFRLNPAETAELEEKRSHRGLGTSDYFRTLMKEDSGVQS